MPMQPAPVALSEINQLWYALPLGVTISLVYAATRHEEMVPIIRHAFRLARLIVLFMGIIFAVLFAMSWWVSA